MRGILIVDDESDAIAVLELFLKKGGYETYSTTNPRSVIEMLKNSQVELVILDWKMPEMDGIDVLRNVRSYSEFDEIPIIITTGVYLCPTSLKCALDYGALDYLRKPINEIELEARIANAFRLVDYHKKAIDMKLELKNQQLEIAETKADLLQCELEKNKREIMSTAISIIQNKKFIVNLKSDLFDSEIKFDIQQQRYLKQVFSKYDTMANSLNWQLFEKRFIELNSGFYNNLVAEFPALTWGELRLCALFKIGFSPKEISVLNYSNYDAVRKAVYRIRKKLGITNKTDINLFLQKY